MRKIYLIVASVLIVSCGQRQDQLPELPIDHYYNVDFQFNVCREYQLVDKEKVQFKFVARHPIERCDGVFGTLPAETSLLMNWIETSIAKVKRLANKYCNTTSPVYQN